MRGLLACVIAVLGCRHHFDGDNTDAALPSLDAEPPLACTPGVTAPRAVTACPFACHNPKLAWVGDRYVLCWKQETTADQSTPNDLLCTTLDRDGMQTRAPVIVPVAGEPTSMAMTWTGNDFVLSYTSNTTGDYEIYVLRFDMAFAPQPVTRVTNVAGTGWGTSNAWTGTESGISFYDNRGEVDPSIYFARVGSNGTNLGELRLTMGTRAFGTSTAWTGTDYFVAWRDIRDSGTWDVYVARIRDGMLAAPVIAVTDNSLLAIDPSLTWTGSTLGVAYTKGGGAGIDDLYMSVLDASGARLAPESRITNVAGTSRAPKSVSLGTDVGFVIGYFDARSGSDELAFAHVDALGVPMTNEVIVAGATPYFTGGGPNAPTMTRSDRGIGVAWPQGTSTDAEIMFVEMCP